MKPILAALKGVTCNPPPWWLMRQAGRYLPEYRDLRASCENFLQLCLTPELAVEATLQPLRRFGMDGAIIFSDILVIPYALGQEVRFVEGEGPMLAPCELEELSRYSHCEVMDRLAPVYRAIELAARSLPSGVTLIGFAGAPWTVGCYMLEPISKGRDWPNSRRQALTGTAGFIGLLELLTEVTAEHLCRQIEAGAEVVQIFESWAGVVPGSRFYQCVIEPTKRLVALVKGVYPQVPIIGFPKGAGVLALDYAYHTGVDGISLDYQWPLEAWPLNPRCVTKGLSATRAAEWRSTEPVPVLTLQGNLDPVALAAGGEVLVREVEQILSLTRERPFIFNLGHGILPHTPPEHVAQLAELIGQLGGSG